VELDEDRDSGYLDTCLADATAGTPRLLLYALRALHFSRAPLASRASIHTAVFETVYSVLAGIPVVEHEFHFFPISKVAEFKALLDLSARRVPLTLSAEIRVNGTNVKLSQLMTWQPFFLSRDGCKDGRFVLRLPRYHLLSAIKAQRHTEELKGTPVDALAHTVI
jgi:hypothetical protein